MHIILISVLADFKSARLKIVWTVSKTPAVFAVWLFDLSSILFYGFCFIPNKTSKSRKSTCKQPFLSSLKMMNMSMSMN